MTSRTFRTLYGDHQIVHRRASLNVSPLRCSVCVLKMVMAISRTTGACFTTILLDIHIFMIAIALFTRQCQKVVDHASMLVVVISMLSLLL